MWYDGHQHSPPSRPRQAGLNLIMALEYGQGQKRDHARLSLHHLSELYLYDEDFQAFYKNGGYWNRFGNFGPMSVDKMVEKLINVLKGITEEKHYSNPSKVWMAVAENLGSVAKVSCIRLGKLLRLHDAFAVTLNPSRPTRHPSTVHANDV